MKNNFWEKPSLVEVFLILLSACLVFSSLPDFNIFYRENPQSFIYDFQVLIGGLLAFGAGFFVWFNGKLEREHKKRNDLNNYYIKKASLGSAIQAEFINIKTQEERLHVLSILQEQFRSIQIAINENKKEYKFEAKYFFFKDEILPVYNANLDKIGLLDPNVSKVTVITASLIVSAVRQIELVGIKNLNQETVSMNEASYIISLAIVTVTQALESIEISNKALKELIDKNYSRLTNVSEYF